MDEVRELPPKPSRWLLRLLAIIYHLYTATLRLKLLGNFMEKGSLLAAFHCDFFVFPRVSNKKDFSHCRFAIMSSNHTDSEYITFIAQYYGSHANRGDSLHEGFHVLRASLRSIKAGLNLLIMVDGPVGPRFKVKPGVIALAKQTKKPIQLVLSITSRGYQFKKSWDRFMLPYPFSTVYTYIGDCFYCDEEVSLEENLKKFNIYVSRQREIVSSLLPKKLKIKNDLTLK